MDKETLSHYGWIVILTLILSVMLALGTPFGKFVAQGAGAVLKGYTSTNQKVLSDEHMSDLQQEFEDYLNSGNEGWGNGTGTNFDGPAYDLSGKTEVGMLDGDHLEYNRNKPIVLSFRSPADYSEFETVLVDGCKVEDSNYTVTEGSTIVTFTPEYSAVLALGNHTVDIVSKTQYAKGSVRVYEEVVPATLTKVKWQGYSSAYGNYGCYIWTDGTNIYYSRNDQYDRSQLVLNNGVWEKTTWKNDSGEIAVDGRYVWTDGTNIYYSLNSSNQYVLKDGVWERKSWGGTITHLRGDYVWSDGTKFYISYWDSSSQTYLYYVLNGTTWSSTTLNGITITGYTWTDGTNIYASSSSGQYVLENGSWVEKKWNGLTSFSGAGVWTDGKNIYYSSGEKQYILHGDTWEPYDWGITIESGVYIWTDGTNTYYTHGKNHYIVS